MNSFRLIKTAINAVKDPERDFTERIFLIFTFKLDFGEVIQSLKVVNFFVNFVSNI